MADFNPDDYLASKQDSATTPSQPSSDSGGFNPDDYLAGKKQSDDFDPSAYIDQKNQDQYGTPGQQALAGIEGVAQGVAGPFATGAELLAGKAGIPGFSQEDIAGRAAANPITHAAGETAGLVGGVLSGEGLVTGAASAAEHFLPEVASKAGSMFLKGAINAGVIQGSDEMSKAMLGQGDPEAPVSSAIVHMGGAALMGGLGGLALNSIGNTTNSVLENLENSKLGIKAKNLMVGMGLAAKAKELGVAPEAMEEFVNTHLRSAGAADVYNYNQVKSGIKAFNTTTDLLHGKIMHGIENAAGSMAGAHLGGMGGALAGGLFADQVAAPLVEKIAGGLTGGASKYVSSALLKAAAEGDTEQLGTLMNYAKGVAKGNKIIQNSVNSLFIPGQQIGNFIVDDRDRDKMKKFVEGGGVNKQLQNQQQVQTTSPQFAEGGEVSKTPPIAQQKPNVIANLYPDQNTMLNAAKGRVYNYLNSVRPQDPIGQRPFDTKPDHAAANRTYNEAIDIAHSPLSVLNKVKNGTITDSQMKHFFSMYPELHNHLSKKINEQIIKKQMHEEEKKPSYKIRQGLSLFLGQPVDSSFSQQAIMAAQQTFATPKQPPGGGGQPPTKAKKGTAPLSKFSQNYRTQDQAREERKDK